MNDICNYRIQLCGEMSEAEINAMSPLQVTIERAGGGTTLLTAPTDQSGFIGLIRHLHGLGFVFVSMTRVDGG